jgi:hypothetical protein
MGMENQMTAALSRTVFRRAAPYHMETSTKALQGIAMVWTTLKGSTELAIIMKIGKKV